jgi:hypothetical protein
LLIIQYRLLIIFSSPQKDAQHHPGIKNQSCRNKNKRSSDIYEPGWESCNESLHGSVACFSFSPSAPTPSPRRPPLPAQPRSSCSAKNITARSADISAPKYQSRGGRNIRLNCQLRPQSAIDAGVSLADAVRYYWKKVAAAREDNRGTGTQITQASIGAGHRVQHRPASSHCPRLACTLSPMHTSRVCRGARVVAERSSGEEPAEESRTERNSRR